MRNYPPLVDRLRAQIRVDPDTECWNWTGCVQANGYGRIRDAGKSYYVHRVAYTLLADKPRKIKPGYDVRQKCTNRRCINPAHLVSCRPQATVKAAKARGSYVAGPILKLKRSGERCPFAKLTWPEVRQIKRDDRPAPAVARDFEVSDCTIRAIRRNEIWKEGWTLLL